MDEFESKVLDAFIRFTLGSQLILPYFRLINNRKTLYSLNNIISNEYVFIFKNRGKSSVFYIK